MAVLRTGTGVYLQTSAGNLLQTSGAGAPAEPDPATSVFNIDSGLNWTNLAQAIVGLPQANGRFIGNNTFYDDDDGKTRYYFQQPYEQPVINGTTLDCELFNIGPAGETGEEHTQYVPFSRTSPNFGSAKYININGPIRHYIDFEFTGTDDWSGFEYIVLIDHLPDGFPVGWSLNQLSPLSLYCRPQDSLWRMWVRGADEDNTTWDRSDSFDLPFSTVPLLGQHSLVLEYHLGFAPAGDHYTKCWLDGVQFVDDSGQNSISRTGGENGSMYCKTGAYAFNYAARAGQTVNISKHRIYDVV